jgi:hypothetical protein
MGRFVVVALLLLVLTTGCGRSFVPARGRVTLDGQPLAGAVVSFHLDSGQGLPAQGATDADGRFALAVVDAVGARPGTYKVVVTRPEATTAAGPGRIIGSGRHRETFPGPPRPRTPPVRDPLPVVYGDLSRTPLRAEIPAGGALNLEIALSSQ